ncbi:hypothetical protein [Lactiplantibacillus daowaiensis]|uniref:Uncharacterized protein n=1 Tax=Lactiplantibacillus daowaiensis TaxID=2559918 RepID=A0ABW1RWW8_9LACO|nr:hypothetical protein [Lactiplantibacillus daowaiensis]
MIFLGLMVIIAMIICWTLLVICRRHQAHWGWQLLWGTLALVLTLVSLAWLYIIIGIFIVAD